MSGPAPSMRSGAEDAKASPGGVAIRSKRGQPWRVALLFAIVYALVGAAWIVLSDYILATMYSDLDMLSRAQTYKGWTYIAVTAVLLALLVKMYLGRLEHSQQVVRESEERFQTLAKSTNDALWDWNLTTNDLWWNEGVHAQLGYRPTDTGGNIQWWYEKIHPDDRERVIASIHGIINSGHVNWRDEYRHAKSDGSYVEVHDRGRVIRDATGKPVRMIGGIIDITLRKKAEQELRGRFELEQLLLQELDHRVRNNLAALLSLVDMTRRGGGDVDSFAQRIAGRVRAMGHVHGLLSDSHWGPLDMRRLITAVTPAECIKRLTIEGDDVSIPPRQVTGLGMVLHELMTNSLKHGALSTPTGGLNVRWTVFESQRGLRSGLEIRWREQGGPNVPGPPSPSVGMELVAGLTRSELGGEARLTFPPGGADHTLVITLDSEQLQNETTSDPKVA